MADHQQAAIEAVDDALRADQCLCESITLFEYVPHWLYIIWSGIYTDMVRYRGRVGAARRIHLEGYPPGVKGGECPTVEEQIAIDGLLPHGQESRLDDFPAWLLDLIDQYTPQPPAEYSGSVPLLNQRKETK